MADAAGARLTATPVYPRAQAELLVGSQLLRGQHAREGRSSGTEFQVSTASGVEYFKPDACILQPAARVTSDFRVTECADMRGIQCASLAYCVDVLGIRSAPCGPCACSLTSRNWTIASGSSWCVSAAHAEPHVTSSPRPSHLCCGRSEFLHAYAESYFRRLAICRGCTR